MRPLLEIVRQSQLETRQGFKPRVFAVEVVPNQPDELTAELSGVADHFLGWDALGRGTRVAPGRLLALDLEFAHTGPFKGCQ